MEKKQYLTSLSVISSFAVVMLHVNGCFWWCLGDASWFSANIIESLFYFAVPIFFMITGATLINYRERYTTIQFFNKRAKKTLYPYLIWTLIYIIFRIIIGKYEFGNITFKWLVEGFINCDIVSVFWFFTPLFSVYLSIPVISIISKADRKKIFSYSIIIGLVIISIIPLVFNLLDIDQSFSFPILGGYLLYVLLGYYIDNYEISKKIRIIVYILGFLGLLIHIIGTYVLSINNGYITSTFKGYLNIPCVLYSVSIFVFFKYFNSNKISNFIHKVLDWFGNLTFGIYLVHHMIIELFYKMNEIFNWGISQTDLLYRTIGGLVIFLICSIIVKLLKKIPVIKIIVP